MNSPACRYWLPVGLLIGVIAVIELGLTGADLHLWGKTSWRSWAYVYFSFQPWLLEGGTPLWPGQRVGMFLTYNFLHIGIGHMTSNMAAFGLLAFLLRQGMSVRALLGICLASAIGGALLFMLLASPYAMTGASGALSGLATAWALSTLPDQGRTGAGQTLIVLARIIALILLIEVLPGGQTAWQTHLGGALAGAAVTLARQYRRV